MNNFTPVRVFVYGTLKRGQPNNFFLKSARFIRSVETSPFYRIFCNGSYPYLVKADEFAGLAIRGELWEVVDRETLSQLDRLEGVGRGGYTREAIHLSDRTNADAYLYSGRVSSCRPAGHEWNRPVRHPGNDMYDCLCNDYQCCPVCCGMARGSDDCQNDDCPGKRKAG